MYLYCSSLFSDGVWAGRVDLGTREVDVDLCVDDPAKSEPGFCGCHNPEIDTDTDSDGTPDCGGW